MLIRNITLVYDNEQYVYKIEEKSDTRAILKAIHKLENELNKVHNGLVKHFKENPDNISVRIY